jgi:hypothetical protein
MKDWTSPVQPLTSISISIGQRGGAITPVLFCMAFSMLSVPSTEVEGSVQRIYARPAINKCGWCDERDRDAKPAVDCDCFFQENLSLYWV